MLYRFNKLLSRIVDIKPDEARMALLLFFFFFLITAPHTIIKALRYADLLFEIGYQGLPLAYLLAAVVTGLVVAFFSRIQFKLPLQIVILSSLVFFIVTGLLFQLFINKGGDLLSYLYWIWAAVLVVVLMSLFGLTINEIFNPRQAKRLIGFCGSGGILGGTVGGLIGYLLTKAKMGAFLLPLACSLLFACLFVVRAIFILHKKHQPQVSSTRKKMEEVSQVGFKESYRAVRKEQYFLLIAAMVILAGIVSTRNGTEPKGPCMSFSLYFSDC
jgi:AAA family ATP:ADP antiporter